jgi:hydroxymethylpyrimidine pyrophosphatase-like HAD family hydrolase
VSGVDLVVTDLDGTLWGADEVVHDRTLAALRTLQERDLPVLVATGRRLRSAVDTLARAGLALPTVVLDGALGRDVGAARTFHRAAFPPERALEVLDAFEAVGLSPCVYVDRPDAEVLVGAAPDSHPRHLAGIGRWLERDRDLRAAVGEEPVLMFAVVAGERPRLAEVAAAVGPAGSAVVTRDVLFDGTTLTVRPPAVSKWDGVLAWCAEQGIASDRVLAVGDGENDLELLTAASVACVVADGCEPALALADNVIDPAHAGGWSAILDLV